MSATALRKAEFFEKVFKEPIATVVIHPGCNEGENVGGIVKSVIVTTKSGSRISAFFKFFPEKDNPHYRRVKESQIFRTEVDVYTKLVPTLSAFIKACTSNATCNLPFPKLFAYFNDDENDYICLEDVRKDGYKMPSVFRGLSFAEASLAIEELARFHAFTHALIRVQGEKIFSEEEPRGKLHRLFSRFDRPGIQKWFNLLSTSVQTAGEVLDSENPILAFKLRQNIPAEKAAEIWRQIIDRTDGTLFPCIVHGDFWTNNFLIRSEEDESGCLNESHSKPTQIKFVDFQGTRRGNIFEDLMYFIFTSTTPEFRRLYLNQLLRNYHASFKNALEWIKCPLPPYFSNGYLLDHFHRFTRAALVNMCFAIPLQLGNPSKVYRQLKGERLEKKEEDAYHILKGDESANQKFDPEAEMARFRFDIRAMLDGSKIARKRLVAVVDEVLCSDRMMGPSMGECGITDIYFDT